MADPTFDDAVKRFLSPVRPYFRADRSYRIDWIHPKDPDSDHDLSLPAAEVEPYIRNFMFGGFYVAFRTSATGDADRLQTVL